MSRRWISSGMAAGAILILLLLVVPGCSTTGGHSVPDFVGSWFNQDSTSTTTIKIDEKSADVFSDYGDGNTTSFSADVLFYDVSAGHFKLKVTKSSHTGSPPESEPSVGTVIYCYYSRSGDVMRASIGTDTYPTTLDDAKSFTKL